jgi:hypothetical protein
MLLSTLWILEQHMMKAIIRALLFGCIFLPAGIGASDDQQYFASRRQIVMKRIGESVAVLVRPKRVHTAFRQDNLLLGREGPQCASAYGWIRHRSILSAAA